MPEPYLVGLDLAGRRVVVVGGGIGGPAAARRACSRPARTSRWSRPEVTPAVEAMATARELRWTARAYRDGDLDGAWYAIACTDDPARQRRGRRRGASARGCSACAPTTPRRAAR